MFKAKFIAHFKSKVAKLLHKVNVNYAAKLINKLKCFCFMVL